LRVGELRVEGGTSEKLKEGVAGLDGGLGKTISYQS
jgi:hypothetical protein